MRERSGKNTAASVRARLYNLRQASDMDFSRLLLLYAQEGFLRRLAASSFAGHFILKGGILFYGFFLTSGRSTRDLDFLAKSIKNEAEKLKAVIRVILETPVDDGLVFDAADFAVEAIDEESEYIGQRVKIRAKLEQAVIPLQIDLGFNDIVYPEPVNISYPTLLSNESIALFAYSWETVIAEKFQAIISFKKRTSRRKDFYDIYFLSRKIPFRTPTLSRSIEKTFAHRNTPLEEARGAFELGFLEDEAKKEQWAAFLRKSHLSAPSFEEVLSQITLFLHPVIEALLHHENPDQIWDNTIQRRQKN